MTWRIAAGLLLALASAGALNWGYYAQHGAASSLPPLTLRRPLWSLANLFRHRRWLAGFFTGIAGWVLYVVALTLAPLSLVQACSAGGLAILAALAGVRTRAERIAVATSVAGLILLAVSLSGAVTRAHHASLAEAAVWMLASGAAAAIAAGPAADLVTRGAGLGMAAGVLYAAGDVGTKAAVTGGFHFWFVPALLACHGLAFVALQFGFQRGTALTTAGLATLWTNALPIAAGMVVFGEPLPGGALGVIRIAAFVAVVAGAALLTRPPGDTDAAAPHEPARRTPRVVSGAIAAIVLLTFAGVVRAQPTSDPPVRSFSLYRSGSAGMTVWAGRIPNPYVPSDHRVTLLYVPPDYSPQNRYPVLYLLHGFWGDPSSFVLGFKLADVADTLISNGDARPFIVVMPPGGIPYGTKEQRGQSEWAGASENFIVHTVVPWVDAHLPTIRSASARAIAGVSAGAFGAVDMAIRHLGVFGTAESWEGYFQPILDGPFAHASPATLDAHNPVLLVQKEARAIRAAKLRFFLSTGGSHGAVRRIWTFQFDRELRGLGIPDKLWSQPSAEPRFGRHQLPSALKYAEPMA